MGGQADEVSTAADPRLNPRRGKVGAKATGKWAKPFGKNQAQYRWDEIHEESGLRIKHAPAILMINQFLRNQEVFVAAYEEGQVCS